MKKKLTHRICEKLLHPFREKLSVGEGTVCLFCNTARGRYSPNQNIVDRFYIKLIFK